MARPEGSEESEMNLKQSSSSSYLVRVWREKAGEEADVRFYLRNLKTGEERYVGNAERLGEILTADSRDDEVTRTKTRDTAQAS